MYIVDLGKRLVSKNNIPLMIYVVLNVLVSGVLLYLFPMLFGVNPGNFLPYLGTGLAVYGVSVTAALSPVGEFILRKQTGCRKIKKEEQRRFIEPLFREVYEKAKRMDPSIPANVGLFINHDKEPNAFATGRKTICVTEGLLHMPEEQIKATLAHEFGHIAHKDTDLIQLVSVGNLVVSAFLLGIRAFIWLFRMLFYIVALFIGGADGVLMSLVNSITGLLITGVVGGLSWLWTRLGVLLVMKSSRSEEYQADAFSCRLGYGNALCALLDSICESNTRGLFAALASSHPDKDDRIARLQKLGCTYRTVYGAQQ